MTTRRDPVTDLLTSTHHMEVLQTLSSAAPYLSGAERILATYILDYPEQVATMSAAQIASSAGVSEATVFRLCRQFGFNGYSAMREQVGEAVGQYKDSFLAPVQVDFARNPLQSRLESTVYTGLRILLDSMAVSDRAIEQAAEAISSCNRIILSGVGAYTARIAEMAAFGFQRLGLTCMLWVDGEASQVTAEMFRSDDVAIGISYSGSNQVIARLLQYANESSAKTIALTNYRFSPVAEQAEIPLITSFRESTIQNFDVLPRVSQLLVIQALIHAVEERSRNCGEGEALA